MTNIVPTILDDQGVLYLDHSTLDTFSLCERRCELRYIRGYAPIKEPDALEFGRAFHAALAVYYKGESQEKAIHAFIEAGRSEASDLAIMRDDTSSARSLERGIDVLEQYFRKHPLEKESWTIATIEGRPAVEIGFACALTRDPPIVYRGRIDLIVKAGRGSVSELWIVDHKTTTALGAKYFDRLRPNDQLTSYVWAAMQHTGLTIRTAMLNAICIYKEDKEGRDPFARGTTQRSEADVAEWYERTASRAMDIYERLQPGRRHGKFRKSTGYCTTWGGCPYRPVCSIPDDPRWQGSKDAVLNSDYEIRPWTPY